MKLTPLPLVVRARTQWGWSLRARLLTSAALNALISSRSTTAPQAAIAPHATTLRARSVHRPLCATSSRVHREQRTAHRAARTHATGGDLGGIHPVHGFPRRTSDVHAAFFF